MIETTQELKDFILWCHTQKIKSVKVGTVEVQFSDIAFYDTIAGLTSEPVKVEERNTSETLADAENPKPNEDEEMLFWSAKT